ncbi:MAG: ABC transporter ATP-binding protein/permease [Bryobacter sp.]|nr:ABC transporter ATP-binding protein/permease [Bryobacter sp.]
MREVAGGPGSFREGGYSWLLGFPYRRCALLAGVRPGHIAANVALATCVAILDASMLAVLVPLGTAVATGSFGRFAQHPVLGPVLRGAESAEMGFLRLAVLMFVLALGKNLLLYTHQSLLARLRAAYAHRIADRLFERYLEFGKAWFDRTGTGAMAAVLEYRFDLVGIFVTLNRVMGNGLMLLGYFAVMILISWRLTLAAILLFPAVHFGSRLILERTRAASRRAKEAMLRAGAQTHEVLAMMTHYQASGAEEQAREKYSATGEEIRRATRLAWQWQGLGVRINELTALLALLLMLGLALRLEPDRSTQPVLLLVFFFIARLSLPAMSVFPEAAADMAERFPRAQELLAMFDDEGKHRIPGGRVEFEQIREGIRIRDLTFAYPGGAEVLTRVSFEVPRGSVTALVGPSGAGKSTILHLLQRHYDVGPGMIAIDGVDLREYRTETLRRGMAVVSQDAPVVAGTLRENLLFGVRREVEDEEMWEAVRAARLEPLVKRLEGGLDGEIGERGVTLSGGERQRVAVARALLRRVPLLLLDEATSGLDAITETMVREAIDHALRGATALVIAHRFATIQSASQIVVLDHGRVRQCGTYQGLLEQGGLFRELWEHQVFRT